MRSACGALRSPLSLRAIAAAVLLLTLAACSGRGFGQQYEYDQQLYLKADGSASVVINASIQALMELHGLKLDPAPRARIDRDAVREMVREPGIDITRVSRPWRRDGRQFIQIRAEVDDVRRLAATNLFKGGQYSLTDGADGTRTYRQTVGMPVRSGLANPGWDGSELVAFKLHLPSRIQFQNARRLDTGEARSHERGNIVTWEQHLSDRLQGKPVEMVVTMDQGSILYRTLWLFGLSFAAALLLLAFLIWRIVRRGRQKNAARV